ncbi:MAG: ABC transporter substrate-binding protein [Microbacterium sp.]
MSDIPDGSSSDDRSDAKRALDDALAQADKSGKTRRRRRTIGIAAVAVVAVGAAIWGGIAALPGDTDAEAATTADKEGGTLIYLDAEASVSTQPQGAGTWQDSAYLENITDRLVWKNPETAEIEPYIAEKWDISDDGKTYRFWIRDGVTYSDGTSLDAENVKRNLEWQANGDEENGIQPSTSWPELDDITVDDNVVTVQLATPYASFLEVLSGWASSLVADQTIDAPLETQQQITGIIGSGPFTVESETYGESIVFVKREGYDWAPPSAGHQGEAYLDRVEVHAVTDDTARLGAFRSDQADVIRYIQPTDEKQLTADGDYQVIAAQGLGATNQWYLRLSVPALQDVRVRQALQSGINRQQIIDELYTDNWQVAKSVVTEDTFGFKDESDKLVYDPDKSNELLDEAGWTERDADGYRTKDGERLTLHTVIDVYDSTAKPLYQLVQAQLKTLGIELDLREADYSQVSEAYSAEDVAATRSGWPYPAPWVTLNTAWNTEKTNAFKLEEGEDPTLDDLLAKQAVATDDTERAELLGQLQDYVIDQAYTLPIIKDSQIFAVQNRIHDFGFSAEARPLFYNVWTEAK